MGNNDSKVSGRQGSAFKTSSEPRNYQRKSTVTTTPQPSPAPVTLSGVSRTVNPTPQPSPAPVTLSGVSRTVNPTPQPSPAPVTLSGVSRTVNPTPQPSPAPVTLSGVSRTVNPTPQPNPVPVTLSEVAQTQSTSSVGSFGPGILTLHASPNPSNMPLKPLDKSKSFNYEKSSISNTGEEKMSSISVNLKSTCEKQNINKAENLGSMKVIECDVKTNIKDERALLYTQTNEGQKASGTDKIKLDSPKKSLPAVQRDVRHVVGYGKSINISEKGQSSNPFLSVEFNKPAFQNKFEDKIGFRDSINSPQSKEFEQSKNESAMSNQTLYKYKEITPKSPKESMTFLQNPSGSNDKYSPTKEDTFKAAEYPKQKLNLSGIYTGRNIFENKKETSLLNCETNNCTRGDIIFTNSSITGHNQEINSVNMNNRKLQARQRIKNLQKNVGFRNHCLKPTTSTVLKHVEKIADSLNTINHSSLTKNMCNENAFSKELVVSGSSEKNGLSDMTLSRNYSLGDCLVHLKNLDMKSEFRVSLLQDSIIYNVQEMNKFVTALKLYPVLNKEIKAELEKLLDNLTSLELNQTAVLSISSSSARPEEIKSNENTCVVSKHTNSTQFNPQHTNCKDLVSETLLPDASLNYNFKTPLKAKAGEIEIGIPKQHSKTVPKSSEGLLVQSNQLIADGNNVPKDQDVTSLSLFKTVLDQLPSDLLTDKDDISLRHPFLYCRICEKQVAFAVSNLIEHLRGKSHKKLLDQKNKLEDETGVITAPPEQKGILKETSTMPAAKYIPQENLSLPPKYEGVLNIVLSSCVEGLLLNVSLYICRPCDFLTNNEEDANNHLVDANHNRQVSEDSKWYFCNSCCMNIFGTDIHIKEHELTAQHIRVLKLKSGNAQNNISEETDRASLHSSCSDLSKKGQARLKPHEILLAIAKESKDRNTGTSIGLYCYLCNKYLVYKTNSAESHFSSELHIKNLSLKQKRNKYACKITFCSICQVDLFGDQAVLNEHATLELHVEMANSMANKSGLEKDESESVEAITELSNESGPHFDLMKSVIKKHLMNEKINESKDGLWGFYCHICEVFSLDSKEWKNHLSTSSHFNRINSSECARKKMLHKCLVCNIELICHDDIFKLHEKSLAHQVVSRRQAKDNASAVDKEDECSTENETSDDYESSDEDDDDSLTNGSDSTSTSSTNKNADKDRMQSNINASTKCVLITRLPANIENKEVFEVFRGCGFIKHCKINEKRHSCTVFFSSNEGAVKALLLRNHEGACYIRGTKVSVTLICEPRKRRNKKNPFNSTLDVNVAATLRSAASVKAVMKTLQEEMVQETIQRDQRSNQIKRDLVLAFPGCNVHLFGSQSTGLATKQSDFDIYIDHDRRSYFKDLPQIVQADFIKKLLALFSRPKSPFHVKESVLEARVPILRVVHLQSNIPCDISCRSGLSVENSRLIRLFVTSDHRVKWLVIMVKWWMRANHLLDSTIFTSYAVTWMVLFFLMRLPKPILCSVNHLRRPCPEEQAYSIGGWDCRFTREIRGCFTSSNNQSNYELLQQFFHFYGTFQFQSIVLCPLTATVIPRKSFDELQVPPAYITYFYKVSNSPRPETLRTTTPICLQDPFDLAHNITKGVNRRDLKRFKALCLSSARICANTERN